MATYTYRVTETPSGWKSLLRTGDREQRIHSAYDPAAEATRAVAAFTLGRASLILVSGCGLGFHVAALRDRFPGIPLVVMELEREAVKLAREHYPAFLAGSWIVHESNDLAPIFESIDMANFRGIAHFVHRPSWQLHAAAYDALAQEISRYISSKVSDLLTRFEFEERWIENILANLPRLVRGHGIRSLFGAYRGRPGIIVSAGPSLRRNVRLLGQVADRALIVCVDTALKVLEKAGVRPHIIMTLDAQKHSLKHFLGQRDTSPLLLADMVSCPDVVRRYRGRAVFSTTAKYYTAPDGSFAREATPFMDWLEGYLPQIGDLQSGGSVATSAFDLLLNLGCDPIVLVGQDLAYTGREIHSSGTHHNEDWLPRTTRVYNLDTINQQVIRKRKISKIEAFGDGGKVISDFVLDLYRGWFEDSAAKVGPRVINATGGGARIRNTVEKELDQLAREWRAQKETPGDIISRAYENAPAIDPAPVREALVNALAAVREIGGIMRGRESRADLAGLIDRVMEERGVSKLYAPFLRRVRTYLGRHALDEERSAEMLVREVAITSGKLEMLLEKCLGNLDKMAFSR